MKSAIKVPSLWSIQSAIKLVVPKDLRLSFSKGFTNIASDQLLHQKAWLCMLRRWGGTDAYNIIDLLNYEYI